MRRTGNRPEVPATAIEGCGGGAMTYWSLMGFFLRDAGMSETGALRIIGASACVNRQTGGGAARYAQHWNDSSLRARNVTCACRPLLPRRKSTKSRRKE